jgi:hypothetical protein
MTNGTDPALTQFIGYGPHETALRGFAVVAMRRRKV